MKLLIRYSLLVTSYLLLFTISPLPGAEFRDTVDYRREDRSAIVEIDAQGSRLIIKKGNAISILSTYVDYTKERIAPFMEYERKNGICKIKLSAEQKEDAHWTRDSMLVYLTPKIPLSLLIRTGLESKIDLSGLMIQELEIDLGIGNTVLLINEPNPIKCPNIKIYGSLTRLKADGLGNLRFDNLYLNLTSGIVTLNMAGRYEAVSRLEAKIGVGTINIILPMDTEIRLNPGSFLHKRITGLIRENGWYISSDKANGKLIMHIDAGLGTLNVGYEE
ncbi:hypothetical protein LR066_04550 [candidate division WOR-3 bacterium]|nr:hypothetical protein [candidate division WOR-3 bacterium]